MLNNASVIKSANVQKIENLKKTGAFVEGSTAPQKDSSPLITPGMSVEEMEKKLDAAGIGYITDEERHKFEE